MPHDVSWDDYNAHQWGRVPRASLDLALDATSGEPGVAVDLGCGEGVEVAALLDAGWTVHAVDGEPAALARIVDRHGSHAALHVQHADFTAPPVLPPADLVHSSYALPYCPPAAFDALWAEVREALRPGAVLAVQLFGPNDDSYGDPEMTFHTEAEAQELLAGLEILHWREEDADGNAYTGPKHWHVFHVVARRPA
ncbi:class I SAM-dependent methyltransferase [Actinotalea sp. M2MS4P-6]|uniref:class I SAM-dependent methyltransferase n=1 Tax=Actinotalea sp. M2MS4P-6 TaxID=2983762 RepID=UPI0021E4CA8F|nr:class I SAM-dependent methyltransferase [Actinotalea sp. M2MS4P-6]MCV2394032.1 class I SAM-dependent methyltransferase [Actinotalea sp. M2MS4P-6]